MSFNILGAPTSTLDTINNLGTHYKDQGKLQKVKEMYQRAFEGKEKALDVERTLTLHTVNLLGNLSQRKT
jgi:hypothetical protein